MKPINLINVSVVQKVTTLFIFLVIATTTSAKDSSSIVPILKFILSEDDQRQIVVSPEVTPLPVRLEVFTTSTSKHAVLFARQESSSDQLSLYNLNSQLPNTLVFGREGVDNFLIEFDRSKLIERIRIGENAFLQFEKLNTDTLSIKYYFEGKLASEGQIIAPEIVDRITEVVEALTANFGTASANIAENTNPSRLTAEQSVRLIKAGLCLISFVPLPAARPAAFTLNTAIDLASQKFFSSVVDEALDPCKVIRTLPIIFLPRVTPAQAGICGLHDDPSDQDIIDCHRYLVDSLMYNCSYNSTESPEFYSKSCVFLDLNDQITRGDSISIFSNTDGSLNYSVTHIEVVTRDTVIWRYFVPSDDLDNPANTPYMFSGAVDAATDTRYDCRVLQNTEDRDLGLRLVLEENSELQIREWPHVCPFPTGRDACNERIRFLGFFEQCTQDALSRIPTTRLRIFPGTCKDIWNHTDENGVFRECPLLD